MTDRRIRVFAVDVRGLPDLPDRALTELFPEERAAAIRKYRMPMDRIRSGWAELLLRAVLEKTCGIPRTESVILRREDGKPYAAVRIPPEGGNGGSGNGTVSVPDREAEGNSSTGLPEISISHSGPWAAVSIGPVPHGLDVETPRNTGMLLTLAERWFLPAETEALRRVPAEEQAELFLRFWTVKESFLKMTGEGLREGPQAADALRLLSGEDSTAVFSTVLPDGAVLSCCGPEELLPETVEFCAPENLRKEYCLNVKLVL